MTKSTFNFKKLKFAVGALGVASFMACGAVAPSQAVEPVQAPAATVTAQFADPGVTYAPFEGGLKVTHQFLGTHTVKGGIYAHWKENNTLAARGGSSVSQLIPSTDEIPVAGGVKQAFGLAEQGRGFYFWSEKTGAHFVDVDTAVGQFYMNNGGPEELGFPVGDVATYGGTSVLPTEYGVFVGHFVGGKVHVDFVPNPAGA